MKKIFILSTILMWAVANVQAQLKWQIDPSFGNNGYARVIIPQGAWRSKPVVLNDGRIRQLFTAGNTYEKSYFAWDKNGQPEFVQPLESPIFSGIVSYLAAVAYGEGLLVALLNDSVVYLNANGDSIATLPWLGVPGSIREMAVDKEGRLILFTIGGTSPFNINVARVKPDLQTIDSTFGNNGLFTYPNYFEVTNTDLDIQPNGRVLVTVYRIFTPDVGLIIRLRDGVLDASWSDDGVLEMTRSPFSSAFHDGAWYVFAPEDGYQPTYFIKVKDNGEPDLNFGINGEGGNSAYFQDGFFTTGKIAANDGGIFWGGSSLLVAEPPLPTVRICNFEGQWESVTLENGSLTLDNNLPGVAENIEPLPDGKVLVDYYTNSVLAPEASYTLTRLMLAPPVGVSDVPEFSITMTPNPTHDMFRIAWDASGNFIGLKLIATTGQVVYQTTIPHDAQCYDANIGALPSGIYICALQAISGDIVTRKVMVAR